MATTETLTSQEPIYEFIEVDGVEYPRRIDPGFGYALLARSAELAARRLTMSPHAARTAIESALAAEV